MRILHGQPAAEARRHHLRDRIDKHRARRGRVPGLAVLLVGDDPASAVYVSYKVKACREVGIESIERRLPSTVTAAGLKAEIDALNGDPTVDGILLQLPLPEHLPTFEAINWISPAKDVDCLTTANIGRLWGDHALTIPCTPWGVMTLLHHYGYEVAGRHAVVVGRSNIVGKPMAYLLTRANATVTLCHSRTRDLSAVTRAADLVVVAAGKPELLGKDDFRAGSIVIDVGIHRQPPSSGKGTLCGDVRYHELEGHVAAATPVPGGIGPMTITMLLENTLLLAERAGAQ
jgi:methylenetetrahydrofolate dehydrogenase (NADP+)/methenyltetrahydrofolate cyclohydrolase